MPLSDPSGKDDPCVDLGRKVREARSRIGMTRKQLAAASGASERYLAHIEAGAGNPSIGVLLDIARALDMAPATFLPLGGEMGAAYAEAVAAVRRLPVAQIGALSAWLGGALAPQTGKAERIVLLGLRGAGKSALGAALAKRLNMPFFEMSKLVEEAYGGDMSLLVDFGGQSALRRHENEAWENLCAGNDRAVIAAPGGIVADGPLYDRVLGSAHSIWLRATPEDHMGRVMQQGDFRPMRRNPGAMADLKSILAARSPDYARADAELDTSAQPFDATLALLAGRAQALLMQKTAL
jgi:XRE family aerobic/anaerobic benzoate catabolism transcriptional regulator